MLQHYQQLDHATAAQDRVRHYRSTAAKTILPLYPSTRDHSQFFAYKQHMLGAFNSLDLTEIISGRIYRDGPGASADANIHATNQLSYDIANQTAYNMLVRTFTAENHGHADAVSIATGQGTALYTHLVQLNEGLMATKIDDTQDSYNHAKQLATETARQFIARTQILRTSLITANVVITERNLNKVIKRGVIIDEHKRDILATYTAGTHLAFIQGLEEQINLDECPFLSCAGLSSSSTSSSQHQSNKRAVANISIDEVAAPDANYPNYFSRLTCFNCGKNGHYANDCPDPHNPEQRSKYGKGAGKSGGKYGGRGGRSYYGGNNFSGRGGRGDPNALRQALNSLVNQLSTTGATTSSAPASTPAPQPSANQQSVDTLLNTFFNCTLTCNATVPLGAAIVEEWHSVTEPDYWVEWLFDTACGAHVSNKLSVFDKNAPYQSYTRSSKAWSSL